MSEPYAHIEEPSARGALWGPIVAVLAVTVLLGGILAALNEDGDDSGRDTDAIALLTGAPDAAAAAKTARIELRAEMKVGGTTMDMTGDGAVEFATGESSLTMTMFGTSFEMRTVGGNMYMRLPEMGRPPGIVQSWIGFPLPKAAGATPAGATPNPASMLDALRGMSNDYEDLGEAEVNGQHATGYRVTIDLERSIAQLSEDDRTWAEQSLDQMRAAGMSEWPMEVWVSDAGLPLRMVMDLDQIGGQAGSMHMQIDYLDFGADVAVDAPPADDVLLLDDPTQIQQLFAPEGAAA